MKTAIGILYAFNGLSMLIVWPLLIINDQAPEVHTNIVYMSFHLVSEFITAIFTMLIGIGLVLKKHWADSYYYLTTGLFIGGGYLAIGYYIFSDLSSALPVLIMLICLNMAGLIFFIIDMQKQFISTLLKRIKISHFFMGIILYTLINITGFLCEMNSGYTYGYVSMVIILILFIIWNLAISFKKDIEII